MMPEENEIPLAALLAALAASENRVREQPDDDDVAEAAQVWELTPTEAFLAGKAAGLAQAQAEIRDKAGWPVEKASDRT
jgi:hypothetical protein